MILFYAWTDTQLLNTINVKLNFYSHEQADLLVFGLSRISKKLLEQIRKKEIFHKVYILNLPDGYMERKRVSFKDRFKALFLGNVYWKSIKQQLQQYIGENSYSHFFTAAFWSETLYVLRYIKKYNSNVQVWFYEDGLADYNGPKNWLYKAVPSRSVKALIRTLLYYGVTPYTYRKYVKGVYLYELQMSNINYLDMIQLPSITKEKNKICFDLGIDEDWEKNSIYEKCDIIYIAEAPDMNSERPMEKIYEILDCIYKVLPDAKIILKAHPTMNSLNIKFDRNRYSNLYVDDRSIRIESILSQIYIDGKIIITGNSTSSLYIRWVYEKRPIMVLINTDRNDKYLNAYIKKFVERYGEGKAYQLENIDMLKYILK